MSNLNDKIIEIVGDEDKVKQILSVVGESMLPKAEYAKVKDLLKEKDSEIEQMKLASMDSTQKLEHELAKAQALQKEYGIKTNRLEAEKLFVEAGLSSEAYSSILDSSVSDDKEKTMSLINSFVGILNKEKENAINKTKEELVNSTPKPTNGEELKPTEPRKVLKSF